MTSNDIPQLLIDIFSKLKKEEVNYCVLRNYEELPYHVGHDVDILLSEDHKDLFDKTIDSLIKGSGWEKVYTRDKYKFHTLILYKIEENNVQLLKFDLWLELSWRGVPWIDSNYILSTKEVYKDVYIPRKGAEAAITVLKELTGGGNVPEKYYDKIINLSLEDKQGFISSLKPIFNKYAEDLYNNASNGRWDQIDTFKDEIKKRIFSNRNKRKKVSRVINYLTHESKRRIVSLFKPKGGLVAFIGPDGSGKSSVIELVTKRLDIVYPEKHMYHMRFGIFPDLKTGLGLTSVNKQKVAIEKDRTTNIGNQKVNSKPKMVRVIASWTVVLYYTIEFFLAHIKVWKTASRSGLVVFDRYYYDYFVQPAYRDLIWPFKKVLLFIVPTPRAVIFLKADPEIVYKRKGELNPTEIKTQNECFSKILLDTKNSHIINTDSKSLFEVEAKVCQIIISTFKA
jgi:thymidylate kinase